MFHVKLIKNIKKMLHVKHFYTVQLKSKIFHKLKILDKMRDFEDFIGKKNLKKLLRFFLTDYFFALFVKHLKFHADMVKNCLKNTKQHHELILKQQKTTIKLCEICC